MQFGLTIAPATFQDLIDSVFKPYLQKFVLWSTEAMKEFQELKHAMCTTPVLSLPYFSKKFVVETGTCSRGVGVVLILEGGVISFYSKSLGPKILGLSTYEKELLVVVLAVTKLRHCLTGHHFIINTD